MFRGQMIRMIAENLKSLNSQLNSLSSKTTLIAVSKTKPSSAIIEAYEAGHRDFGENYIQELQQKSEDAEILTKCPEIRWHMIGPIQSNKAQHLAKVRNLHAVHTVTSEKLVNKLQNNLPGEIQIFVQINTSGEASKSGLDPSNLEALEALLQKIKNATHLNLQGFMTIGRPVQEDNSHLLDYKRLIAIRNDIDTNLKLSMGMSADYVQAIEHGTDYVRIGSKIFGARDYSKK